MLDEIERPVQDFITENFLYRGEVQSLSKEDSLFGTGLIDSMGILELVTFLESSFSIKVADEDVVPENMDTIGRIVTYVQRKRRRARARPRPARAEASLSWDSTGLAAGRFRSEVGTG
jgi:acyl carrier protein